MPAHLAGHGRASPPPPRRPSAHDPARTPSARPEPPSDSREAPLRHGLECGTTSPGGHGSTTVLFPIGRGVGVRLDAARSPRPARTRSPPRASAPRWTRTRVSRPPAYVGARTGATHRAHRPRTRRSTARRVRRATLARHRFATDPRAARRRPEGRSRRRSSSRFGRGVASRLGAARSPGPARTRSPPRASAPRWARTRAPPAATASVGAWTGRPPERTPRREPRAHAPARAPRALPGASPARTPRREPPSAPPRASPRADLPDALSPARRPGADAARWAAHVADRLRAYAPASTIDSAACSPRWIASGMPTPR